MSKGNSIVSDVFGELLETGKATVKAGTKAVSGASGLDWLEKMAPQKKPAAVSDDDKQQKEQIKRLAEMDKRRSRQAYEEIQRQIRLIQKQKASQPRKYVTGATGFDEEQVKAPETFFEKMKKKKEAMAKKLPWTSKQGMGTGEITRGVSG
ncbi:MAG: hypothetical protein UV54_C0034G0005 [Candidatus Beckwithbacteria bacterium GW2011_GWA2_43_10]|uniref:Uncharacterized protein n=1 Tax=Candidatus Beckwithbacteria bacterium GW2011_GWA2_43_10 TaxID=1618369 RepID=A0A0G1C1S6_9BACT|nr:MAG: hypothetical protein UV54_C0034G0005 [Candidatus Beckwithbacteria bacterium GW2011_GWA2_43_10]